MFVILNVDFYGIGGKICKFFNIKETFFDDYAYVSFILSVISVAAGVFFNIQCKKTEEKFRRKLKRLFLKDLLKVFGDWKIESNENAFITDIQATELFPGSMVKADDYLSVLYKNTRIHIMEANFFHHEGKNSKLIIDFDGIILRTKVKKDLCGMLIALPAKRKQSSFIVINFYGKIDISERIKSYLERITELNSWLCEDFDIYSTDYKTASEMISREFEDVILKIRERFETKSIKFVLMDGYLYMFLDEIKLKGTRKGKHGFFEVGNLNETLWKKNIYDNLYNEISAFEEIFEKLDAAI